MPLSNFITLFQMMMMMMMMMMIIIQVLYRLNNCNYVQKAKCRNLQANAQLRKVYCITNCKIAMHLTVHQKKSRSCASYESMYRNRAIDPRIISLSLNGAEWSNSHLGRFTAGERSTGTPSARSWVCHGVGLDTFPASAGNQTMILRSFSQQPSHCTESERERERERKIPMYKKKGIQKKTFSDYILIKQRTHDIITYTRSICSRYASIRGPNCNISSNI